MMNEYSLNNPKLALGQYGRMSRWNESVVHQSLRIDSIFRTVGFVVDFLGQKEQTNVV